jgi:hypothetical protein
MGGFVYRLLVLPRFTPLWARVAASPDGVRAPRSSLARALLFNDD